MRYSETFKRQCVKYLRALRELGHVLVKGDIAINRRELCDLLKVSSYSIYNWDKEISESVKFTKEELEKMEEAFETEEFKEEWENLEEKGEMEETVAEEIIEKGIEELKSKTTTKEEFKEKMKDWINQEINGDKATTNLFEEIFGQRFFSWFARCLKIPGYSNMKLNQLKFTIGMKLIKESKLA